MAVRQSVSWTYRMLLARARKVALGLRECRGRSRAGRERQVGVLHLALWDMGESAGPRDRRRRRRSRAGMRRLGTTACRLLSCTGRTGDLLRLRQDELTLSPTARRSRRSGFIRFRLSHRPRLVIQRGFQPPNDFIWRLGRREVTDVTEVERPRISMDRRDATALERGRLTHPAVFARIWPPNTRGSNISFSIHTEAVAEARPRRGATDTDPSVEPCPAMLLCHPKGCTALDWTSRYALEPGEARTPMRFDANAVVPPHIRSVFQMLRISHLQLMPRTDIAAM